jgi:hypothetical protein
MLRENTTSKDVVGNRIRWFSDGFFDLIYWFDDVGQATGFQLCYDLMGNEHALTWRTNEGLRHHRVDDGEQDPTKNLSPVLTRKGGVIPFEMVIEEFSVRGARLDEPLYSMVMNVLQENRGKIGPPDAS